MAEKSSSIQKKLQEISVSQDFSRLDSFKDPKSWQKWTCREQEILASLFLQKGEIELQTGNGKVFESFQIASLIAPKNPNVFYRQGLIYAEHGQNIHCLRNAEKTLTKAVLLHPQFFDALYALANVLVQLGIFLNDQRYLGKAHEKFQEASGLLVEDRNWVKAEFFWDWGKCWHIIAKDAGEVPEYRNSIDKFQVAASLGMDVAEFWYDYGLTMIDYAHLMNDSSILTQASDILMKASLLNPNAFEPLFHLGCVFYELYSLNPKEDFFRESDQYFARASEIVCDSMALWLKWGVLYSQSGRRLCDLDRLELSFEKFLNADACEPNHPKVLSLWAEAQVIFGSYLDDYEQLRSAERKILRAIDIGSEDPSIWCIYGNFLNELGRYFGEDQYYVQAIEKFTYALSLDRNNPLLYYGLATSYYNLGEFSSNISAFEKSANYCSQAINAGGESCLQFWNDWGTSLIKIAEITSNKFYIQAAIEKFKKAVLWPNLDFEQEGMPLDWIANFAGALDFMGEMSTDPTFTELAVQIFTKLIQQQPHQIYYHYQYAIALSHYGEMYADTPSYEKAYISFNFFLENEPEDENAWNDWGITLICHGLTINCANEWEKSYELLREAEEKLMTAISLGNKFSFYNLACLYSLTSQTASSLAYLKKAEKTGFLPSIDQLLSDDWLIAVRTTDAFKEFIVTVASKTKK